MHANQMRTILIFLITSPTIWLFAGYPYTTGKRKAAKISNKNSAFNWVHSLHTELMNASHPLIYLQIHVTIFPPMEKLLSTLIQTYSTPQYVYALRYATPILTKYQDPNK